MISQALLYYLRAFHLAQAVMVRAQRKRIHVARSRHIIPLDQADAPVLESVK